MSEKHNFSVTDWLGITNAPNWGVAGPLGKLFSVAVVLLFALALLAAFGVLGRLVLGGSEVTLGAGALVAALLGAPFVIWGTVLKHQTVMFQKEGHMTDRINKAVEQLGTEKTIKYEVRVISWRMADSETLYETRVRLGEEANGPEGSVLVNPSIWKTVEETVPNIEVRIGAILSLERIAQDSTRHDKGRDHVRVMEILCAYIRENSNATPPQDHPFGEWRPLEEDATEKEREEHIRKRDERFGQWPGHGKMWEWAQQLPEPRADLALALRVLGRRTAEQRKVEAAWPNAPVEGTIWPFDLPCPRLPDRRCKEALTKDELDALERNLNEWKEKLVNYSGYRLDLRMANLQRADMSSNRTDGSDAVFSGALLEKTKMQGANLSYARLIAADITHASLAAAQLFRVNAKVAFGARVNLEGANLFEAQLDGAWLRGARLNAATPHRARFCFANLIGAQFVNTDANGAMLQGALLQNARFDGTDLGRVQLASTFVQRTFFDHETSFVYSDFSHCALKDVNFVQTFVSFDQVNLAFGDISVLLPERLERPRHWVKWNLRRDGSENGFEAQWRKWQADPMSYIPPPEPKL